MTKRRTTSSIVRALPKGFGLLISLSVFVACGDDDGGGADAGGQDASVDTARLDGETADSSSADSSSADTSSGDSVAADTSVPPPCSAVDPEVVFLTTDDEVELGADVYFNESAPVSLVLVHGIPPNFNRDIFPRAGFIDRFVERCFNVINFDRRGAGSSGGVARDAYLGPGGGLDVKAAVRYLLDAGARPEAIRMLASSNGTTSIVDYAALASEDESLPAPEELVMLSAGEYTEAQNALSAGFLSDTPILFTFAASESDWHDVLRADAPASWQFVEYAPGSHGVLVFRSDPESITRVLDFLD